VALFEEIPDFGSNLRGFEGLGEQWRRQQDDLRRSQQELDRVLDDMAQARAAREARQAEAETATIESAQLLDAMVSYMKAQSAQLATASTLLEALATHAAVASEQEERRWRRTWPVMLWTLVAGAVAALGAVVAILVTVAVSG
jgi:hypothetical protein